VRLRRDLRLVVATLRTRLFGRSDRARWSDDRELLPEWDERARIVASMIPPHSRVIEFGAGRRQVERFLDPSCSYVAADLLPRGEGSLVIDLNARPLPRFDPFDVAVFCGVLEYVRDVAAIIGWLRVGMIVASYEVASSRGAGERLRRARIGWVSSHTRDDFLRIFSDAGFELIDERLWRTPTGDEPIFLFGRQNSV